MKFIAPILLWLLFVIPGAGFAQEQETEEKQGQTETTQENEPAQPDAEEKDDDESPAQAIRESFRPSEEISEDLSVSFPVDI